MLSRRVRTPIQSIALLVTTYNKPWALERMFAGVARQAQRPAEMIVADDGSGPETKRVIEHWRDRLGLTVTHVWQPNEGYRRARVLNLAIRAARADYLVLIDGDCVPPRQVIAQHAQLAEAGHCVLGGRCRIAEAHAKDFRIGESNEWAWRLRGWMERRPNYWPWPRPWVKVLAPGENSTCGCNFAAWRRDLVHVNGFDELFVGWGHEDRDLTLRLGNAGVRAKDIYGQAYVYHLDHPELPRDRSDLNRSIHAEAISTKRIRAERGLDGHGGAVSVPA